MRCLSCFSEENTMKTYLWILIILFGISVSCVYGDPFIDNVVDVDYGIYAGHGQDRFPEIVDAPYRDSAAVSTRMTNETHSAYRCNNLECIHDSGHDVPPIEPPDPDTTKFWSLWQFMMDHPYGTDPSPYENGLPAGFPDWCQVAQ